MPVHEKCFDSPVTGVCRGLSELRKVGGGRGSAPESAQKGRGSFAAECVFGGTAVVLPSREESPQLPSPEHQSLCVEAEFWTRAHRGPPVPLLPSSSSQFFPTPPQTGLQGPGEGSKEEYFKICFGGTSLAVRWLGLCASTAGESLVKELRSLMPLGGAERNNFLKILM